MGELNLNLPIIQEGESFRSFCDRTVALNQLDDKTMSYLLQVRDLKIIKLFENLQDTLSLLGVNKEPNEILYEHTIYKIHRFFTPKNDLKETEFIMNTPGYSLATGPLVYNIESMVCPLCAEEDIEKFGYPIKRMYQNYHNVKVCYKHACNLMVFNETHNNNNDKILELTPEYSHDNDAIEFAEFIHNLSEFKCSFACLENTEKIVMPYINKQNYEQYTNTDWDNRCFYSLAKKNIKLINLDSFMVARVIFQMYKDDFDLLIKRYMELEDKTQ